MSFTVKSLLVLNIFMLIISVVVLEFTPDRRFIKCLVCQRVVEEMSNEISKVSPSLKYSSKTYNLDGISSKDPVEMRRSEVFLVELMDHLCKIMNDYVRAVNKETGQVEVIKLLSDGNMNPLLHNYDIVQDGDFESLEYYCNSILSEYDEKILKLYMEKSSNIESNLCYSTEICMSQINNDSDLHNEL